MYLIRYPCVTLRGPNTVVCICKSTGKRAATYSPHTHTHTHYSSTLYGSQFVPHRIYIILFPSSSGVVSPVSNVLHGRLAVHVHASSITYSALFCNTVTVDRLCSNATQAQCVCAYMWRGRAIGGEEFKLWWSWNRFYICKLLGSIERAWLPFCSVVVDGQLFGCACKSCVWYCWLQLSRIRKLGVQSAIAQHSIADSYPVRHFWKT